MCLSGCPQLCLPPQIQGLQYLSHAPLEHPTKALFLVEVLTESSTMAAVSSIWQWFRLGRAQPLGCGRMGISLEEILKQVSPMVVCSCAVPPFY